MLRLFFPFLFGKKWRECPSGGKSKKDGGSSLLTTDSDSMAISFFSFSLLKGWQGDAFRRRDEEDSLPRKKKMLFEAKEDENKKRTENGVFHIRFSRFFAKREKMAILHGRRSSSFSFFQRKIKSRLLETRTKEGGRNRRTCQKDGRRNEKRRKDAASSFSCFCPIPLFARNDALRRKCEYHRSSRQWQRHSHRRRFLPDGSSGTFRPSRCIGRERLPRVFSSVLLRPSFSC